MHEQMNINEVSTRVRLEVPPNRHFRRKYPPPKTALPPILSSFPPCFQNIGTSDEQTYDAFKKCKFFASRVFSRPIYSFCVEILRRNLTKMTILRPFYHGSILNPDEILRQIFTQMFSCFFGFEFWTEWMFGYDSNVWLEIFSFIRIIFRRKPRKNSKFILRRDFCVQNASDAPRARIAL